MNINVEKLGVSKWSKTGILVCSLLLAGCTSSSTPATTTTPPTSASIAPPTTTTIPATPAPTTVPPTTAPPTTAPATTAPPTPPPTTAPASEADAATARVIEFYQKLYACYGPDRCDFQGLMSEYLAPGSPALPEFTKYYDAFLADDLTSTGLDGIKIAAESATVDDGDGAPPSGTIVLCQFDPSAVIDASGAVVNDNVSVKRTTVVVVKPQENWLIVDTSTEKFDPNDNPCVFE